MSMAKSVLKKLPLLVPLLWLTAGPLWAQNPLPQDEAVDDGHGHALEGVPDGMSQGMEYPGAGVDLPEQPLTVMVMGHEILPKKGEFEVTKDMNVRGGPGTGFKRVEGLLAGDRVRAVGKTEDGEWTAVSRDGETLGFVYSPFLVPVLDGRLAEPFFGSFMSSDSGGGVACDYRFRFERKSDVEGGDFETADYEVRLRCASREGAALFYIHMFLTEAPVDEGAGLHLIGIDVRSIGDGMEEFLSTSYLYHPKSGKMTFDGHTLPRFALPPKEQSYQTKSIKDALKTALESSMSTWTPEAWSTLFAKMKPQAE